MNADVVPMNKYRREAERSCYCRHDFTCYPHRLVDLAARVEDMRADVEVVRFCDWPAFDRMTSDVLNVLASITAECLPDERDVQ